MRKTRNVGPSGFVYLFAAAVALSAGAARPAVAQVAELPRGMVAFFTGLQACPTGWIEPPEAAGRLVVGVNVGHAVGGTIGVPLGELEDRKHRHPFTAQFRVPAESITSAEGTNRCCANYGTRTALGSPTTGESTSNLPFIQLLLCEKL